MEEFAAGSWRTFRRGEIYIGSAWRRLTRAEIYAGGQWRTVARFVDPLVVNVLPNEAYGYANPLKPTAQTITTNSVVATPSGGLAPYTYAWDSGNSPSMAGNSFTRTVPADSDVFDSASVVVTDALGSVANATINVTFSNQSQLG